MRLSSACLDRLPASVQKPGYDRSSVINGIVHLGVGAFHRAHQAVIMDDALSAGETGWGIVGASLRSPETRDALAPQDGLYTMSVRDASGEQLRIIGAMRNLLVAPENPEALLAAMAAPDIRIVTLTVTEKGYCHDPATGTLIEDHPDIRHDLAHPEAPRSAIGFLAFALDRRRKAGLLPFTILSCDNLPQNGRTVKRVVDRFAALVSTDLGLWVAANVACPAGMVDRIVPATTDEDRARIAASLGVDDRWPVVTEPFWQWVIEDNFPTGRPDFARYGVTLVEDVTPFEHMKLRLLNGSHSTMAYLGYLAGYETIAQTMADPAFEHLIRSMMDEEITSTLKMPTGTDLSAYKDALITRFKNPALKHRTWQIAMDGSQKLPQRLLGTIRDRLKTGESIRLLCLGVAGWMRYVTGTDENGQPIDIRDPLAEKLKITTQKAVQDASQVARALLSLREIFGDDLPADPRFTNTVEAALAQLMALGAAKTIDAARE